MKGYILKIPDGDLVKARIFAVSFDTLEEGQKIVEEERKGYGKDYSIKLLVELFPVKEA